LVLVLPEVAVPELELDPELDELVAVPDEEVDVDVDPEDDVDVEVDPEEEVEVEVDPEDEVGLPSPL